MSAANTSMRELRLLKLKESAEEALTNHRKDGYRQRQALSKMAVDAEAAGVALLDWLELFFEERFTNKPAVVPVKNTSTSAARQGVLVCKVCDKEFATQRAFNGHGESRCLRKRESK